MAPIFSLHANATSQTSIWFLFSAKTLSFSSILFGILSIHINATHTERLSFKQNPSSSSILFYMLFQALRDSNNNNNREKNSFLSLSLSPYQAWTHSVASDRQFHFKIFCCFYSCTFFCVLTFYFDFCTVLCHIEINNKQGITFNTRQKLVYIQKP